ncbi:MAG: nicotinate-nucleotide adenylyltransferase [Coriobacteriales bacterium]|jgi:nicotinate-nucleotide adenylyltransferase|nr:nicotinate-nucleotide adenylyltransferase [Coriobacteriales bacterium]
MGRFANQGACAAETPDPACNDSSASVSPCFEGRINARSPQSPFKLGFYGGTFDPVHIGHLVLAQSAREQLGLDGVLFVPTGQPAHKLSYCVASSEDRLAMLELAIEGHEGFDLSRIETGRPGVTYTIDTLRALKARYGDKVELYLVCGQDAAQDLPTWKDAAGIASLVTVAYTERGDLPGLSVSATKLPQFVFRGFTMPRIDVSSSQLRDWMREGKSVSFLTPLSVERYMRERRLYV